MKKICFCEMTMTIDYKKSEEALKTSPPLYKIISQGVIIHPVLTDLPVQALTDLPEQECYS